jgi:hypothetical protein
VNKPQIGQYAVNQQGEIGVIHSVTPRKWALAPLYVGTTIAGTPWSSSKPIVLTDQSFMALRQSERLAMEIAMDLSEEREDLRRFQRLLDLLFRTVKEHQRYRKFTGEQHA